MAPRPKLEPEQQRELCCRYQTGETFQRLSEDFCVSLGTVHNILVAHGIERTVHFRNLTSAEVAEVRRRYKAGENSYQLAAVFGVSRPAICAHLRAEKNPRPTRSESKTRYRCNHRFFNDIDTPEKAYVLGFIATDGHISPKGFLSFGLKGSDADILRQIARLLETDRPVQIYNCKGYEVAHFAVRSDQITADLANLGIAPRKTFTVGWPELRPDLCRHFLRGAMDGDGSFYSYRTGRQVNEHLATSFIGNERFSPACMSFLIQELNLPTVKLWPRYQKDGTLATLSWTYSGNSRCLPIANLLYRDATIYLPRKRDIVLNHYRSLPKYRDRLEFG